MLTIRLQRVGRKNDPSFRVILVEKKRAAKTGQFMEVLGSYDARTGRIALQGERIREWMGKGVTVSDNLHNLLISNKVIEGKKINVLPRKSPPKKEEDAAVQAPAAAQETTEAGTEDVSPAAEVKAEEKAEEKAPEGDNDVAPDAEAK
jgi:small subunit ribosomal protein S16